MTAKLFIMRNLMRGISAVIIDPQGEYVGLTKKFGGKVVDMGETCGAVNPFDMMGLGFDEKISSLLELLGLLLSLSDDETIFIANALTMVYATKGIMQGKPETWANDPPILQDLYRIVSGKKYGRIDERAANSIEAKLRPFVKGSMSFLNRRTSLEANGNLVCFDLSNTPERLKPAMMFLAMDFAARRMKLDRERKLLIVDEAWSLLKLGKSAEHIFGIIKTARKFGLAVVIVTQEADDLLATQAGKAILANTAWKFLCRQEPAVIEDLSRHFRLNHEEKSLLLTAMPGEGLLFALNDHLPLRVVPSPGEYRLATTKPDEMEKSCGAEAADTPETQNCPDGSIEHNSKPAEEKSALRKAVFRAAANEIMNYTDSISISPASGIDIVFQAHATKSYESVSSFGVVVARGLTKAEAESLKEKNSLAELVAVSAESLPEFKEKLKEIFL